MCSYTSILPGLKRSIAPNVDITVFNMGIVESSMDVVEPSMDVVVSFDFSLHLADYIPRAFPYLTD